MIPWSLWDNNTWETDICLTASFKRRFISAHSSNFWIFIQWIGFGLFILWIDQDEASENASHLVNGLIRLCIKRSSVNTELRQDLRLQPWLLRFWIRAQVLITKSLCVDPQIAPRFHPRLTFKSKHKAWILKISMPNSIPRTPRGGCVEIKKLSAGVIFGSVREGNGPGACLRSPSHCQCVVVCLSWHVECQQQPGASLLTVQRAGLACLLQRPPR